MKSRERRLKKKLRKSFATNNRKKRRKKDEKKISCYVAVFGNGICYPDGVRNQ
ncbi:MAG: hypothetical protein ACOX3L_09475 [Lutisporaceae bacterium]